MRRLLVPLLVLLSLPLGAADVPLSDRPLAPIPGISRARASASPDAVLAVFVAGSVFAQRLALDGTPIDAGAMYLGSGSNAEVLWNGSRWIVLWSSTTEPSHVAYVSPDGTIDGPYQLRIRNAGSLMLLGNRVVVSAWEPGQQPAPSRRFLYELVEPDALMRLFSIDLAGDDLRDAWAIGLDQGPAVVVSRSRYVRPFFRATITIHRPDGGAASIDIDTTAPSLVTFIPRREGGGLLVWNEGGLRGAIIGSDATISTSFPIGPRGTLSERLVAEARSEGWDLVFGPWGENWFARVDLAGRTIATLLDPGASPAYLLSDLAAAGADDLLFERDPVAGMKVRLVRAGALGDPIAAGAGGAAQFLARAATGGGVDLVVWEEQSATGIVLRATRIAADGTPLDGPGLLVAGADLTGSIRSSYQSAYDVAFDGEAFVVAWVRRADEDTVFMRRVWPDGTLAVALGIATWGHVEGVTVAGAGSGRSAVAWSGYTARVTNEMSLSVLVPIADGRIGAPTEIGSGPLGWAVPSLAASGDRYLAVFNDIVRCQVTCEHFERPYARLFTFDGAPLTEARRISEEITGPAVPEVVSDGRFFFVLRDDVLVTIDPDLMVIGEKELASRGSLAGEGPELYVDRWRTRLVYSRSGELLRLEPLPPHFEGSEFRAARLAHRRFVMRVDGHPSRLVIRSLDEPLPRTADLAVAATGEIVAAANPSGGFLATFRVEHRGGAPVRALDVWSDRTIYMIPIAPSAKPFEVGDAITITVSFPRATFGASLWVAGDVIDPIPANNVATIAPRERRRTIGR